MFKILKTLFIILWLIDILNINFTIGDIKTAEFLDITVPLNGWFWFLFWLLVPDTKTIVKGIK